MARTIFFSHPVNMYGTPLERALLALIRALFPSHEIVNPSDKKHVDVVEKIKEHDPNANVMGYFSERAKECDELILLPFGDGKWGKGVYTEAETKLQNGWRIFVFDPLTFEISEETQLNPALCLSIEETRARIRNPDRSIRPYE